MGKADLHIHTIHSWDGTCSVHAVLKYASDQAHLDCVAITDHDEVTGAQQAAELAPAYGIQVIPGCEITTGQGHLIALFIREKVPAGLSLIDTLLRVGEQGGLCIAAHPTARGCSSLSEESIRRALGHPQAASFLAGIEVFNAGIVHRKGNVNAQRLARNLPLAPIGSSDSHMLWTIGRGFTKFKGSTAADLRSALESRRTQVPIGKEAPGIGLVLGWMRGYLLRKAGWVESNLNPAEPVRLGRLSALSPEVAATD